jgi:hypothetical protein
MGGRRAGIAALRCALVLVLSAVGCSDASNRSRPEESAGTPTSRPGSDATTTTVDREDLVQAEVEEAYTNAAAAFVAASAISDADLPALVVTHTGPMLEQRRAVLRARQRDGRAGRQPDPSAYRNEFEEFELVDEATARLVVCSVDDGIVYEVSTGRVVNDEVETSRLEAVLRFEDETWKLAERVKLETWPGVGGCAAE